MRNLLLLAALVGALPFSAHADEIKTAEAGEASVSIASTKGQLTVAEITGRAYASNGYASATVVGYREVCQTPCQLKVPAGLHELSFYGGGAQSASLKYDFKADSTTTLEVRPASAAFRYLSIGLLAAGASAITFGALGLNHLDCSGNRCKDVQEPYAVPLIAAGSVMAVGGITFYITPRSKVVVVPG
ncbi:MAG: hypothetical protein Q8P41_22120 [Pseudomonadota bacterium]|nr:hypothetical protein [Pseudomonadota bacterium]